MKRLFFPFATALLIGNLCAQPVISYSNHALLPGENNPMTLCNYTSPGNGGINVSWDFKNLVAVEQFTGLVNMVVADNNFSEANVELEEFGTSFFFKSDENSIQQVGYASKDERTIITYAQPYEKMVFPLNYGDVRNCTFSGTYTFDGQPIGEVTGTGTIEADAWGTIILPNNKVYENTVRVKSVKSYTVTFNSNTLQDVEVVTYRWYNNYHRYPLLVLTEYTTISNNNTSKNYQSAYNNNAITGIDSPGMEAANGAIKLYPNPAETELNLYFISSTEKTIQVKFFDISGKEILLMQEINIAQGENIISFSKEIAAFKPGSYVLKIISDNKTDTREFILTK